MRPLLQIAPRHRDAISRTASRLGLDAPLRFVYERLEPTARRDRIDNEHLRLLLAFSLCQDSNCIDIGAHSGEILREIVRCAPDGRHLAFEPLPEFARRLSAGFPGVDVRNVALSNAEGEAEFSYVTSDPMQSGLKRRSDPGAQTVERLRVAVHRLDDALPPGYVPAFIKIDVEGAERQVIEGAMETITRHHPVIFFEHGPGAEDQYETSPGQVYDLLVGQAGLRIFDVDGAGPYSRTQFEAVYHQPIWNFVAHR